MLNMPPVVAPGGQCRSSSTACCRNGGISIFIIIAMPRSAHPVVRSRFDDLAHPFALVHRSLCGRNRGPWRSWCGAICGNERTVAGSVLLRFRWRTSAHATCRWSPSGQRAGVDGHQPPSIARELQTIDACMDWVS